MIFDLHGQPLVGRIERGPLRNSPGFKHTVHFKTEVVMKPGGAVPLDYESMPLSLLYFWGRLGSRFKAPLTFVFFKGHSKILNRCVRR